MLCVRTANHGRLTRMPEAPPPHTEAPSRTYDKDPAPGCGLVRQLSHRGVRIWRKSRSPSIGPFPLGAAREIYFRWLPFLVLDRPHSGRCSNSVGAIPAVSALLSSCKNIVSWLATETQRECRWAGIHTCFEYSTASSPWGKPKPNQALPLVKPAGSRTCGKPYALSELWSSTSLVRLWRSR